MFTLELQTRESQTQKGGGGEMSSQYYYIRQSNCSLKLVEKEKKIMDYKQIQFDRKQTNEIKSND